MKKLGQLFLLIALASSTHCAMAASYQGYVSNVMAFNGSVYVAIGGGNFDGAAGSCANGSGMIYSIDPSTPGGKALLALAISAKLTGKLVYSIGSGACTPGSPFGGGSSSEVLQGLDLKG